MMYQYGNVAVQPEQKPNVQRPQSPQPKRQSRPQQKRVSGLSGGEKVLYLFGVIVAVLICVPLLSNQSEIAEVNVQMQVMERETQALQEENARLVEQIDYLRSPDRIQAYAEQELGMRLESSTVRVLSGEKTGSR